MSIINDAIITLKEMWGEETWNEMIKTGCVLVREKFPFLPLYGPFLRKEQNLIDVIIVQIPPLNLSQGGICTLTSSAEVLSQGNTFNIYQS